MSSQSLKILMSEHDNILEFADILEQNIEKADENWLKKAIDFIRNYADKFHHAKEEDILFKEFLKCVDEGKAHCNPVEQMLFEHNIGRENVKKMEEGLKEKDKSKVKEGAIGYISLIREHINKENNILYPMIEDILSENVKKKMLTKFKSIEEKNKEIKKQISFIAEGK